VMFITVDVGGKPRDLNLDNVLWIEPFVEKDGTERASLVMVGGVVVNIDNRLDVTKAALPAPPVVIPKPV